MNGALASVSAFGPITFVMAFAGPTLTLILIGFLWFGPRRFRLPAVLPGIPLALTSIALQVLAGGIGILTAFQEIATQRLAGVRNVAGSMAVVTGSFTISIVFSIGCIAALAVFQVIRDRRDEQTEWSEPGNKLAPRIVFFLTALSALATMVLLWLFERTLDLIMVIVDSTRRVEAQQRLGDLGMGDVAATISHRLILCEAFSFVLLAMFMAAPFSLLAGEAPEWVRGQSWTLAILTALCLIPFGIAFHQEILYVTSLTHPR
ncbi:MAG: hypothetical protein ABR987_18170 [Terracidiphilus sp.]